MDVWKGEGRRDEVRSRGRKSRYLGSRNIQERLSQRDTKDSVRQATWWTDVTHAHAHLHTHGLWVLVTLKWPYCHPCDQCTQRCTATRPDQMRAEEMWKRAQQKRKKRKFSNYREQRSPTYTRWDGATGIGAKNLKSWMLHWEKERKVGRVGGRKRRRGNGRIMQHAILLLYL